MSLLQVLQIPFIPQELLDSMLTIGWKALIMAVILVVGWIVGRVIGAIMGKVVSKIGGDAVFRKTALGRSLMKSGYTASEFSKTVTKWIIYIAAILVALQSLDMPFISGPVDTFLIFLPRLIAALIIVVVGLTVSDWIGDFAVKGFTSEQRETFYLDLIGNLIKVALYFLVIAFAISQLEVDMTIVYILATAFAWSIAIAVGVAAGIVVGWLIKDKVKELLPQG